MATHQHLLCRISAKHESETCGYLVSTLEISEYKLYYIIYNKRKYYGQATSKSRAVHTQTSYTVMTECS